MSEFSIEEKIRKIRQDLYNFNLGGNGSLEKYLEVNTELKFSELESPYKANIAEYEKIGLKSSHSAENLQKFEDFDGSPNFLKYNPESTANYQEFTLNKENKLNNDKELSDYNHALLASLNINKSKYLQMLADKEDKISILEQNLRKTEAELNYYKQGKANIDEFKSSTNDLKCKADDLDIERVNLVKENSQLHQKLSKIENDFNCLTIDSYNLKEENLKLRNENTGITRKLAEISKENELLYKTLKEKQKINKKKSKSESCSPKKYKSPRYSGKIDLNESNKRNHFSDEEKTERKIRSPSILNNRLSKIPRPRSKSKEYKKELSHSTSCQILKEIMNLYSIDSPTLLISLIKSGLQDLKTFPQLKSFSTKIQNIIVSNSPPNTFKTSPGLKSSIK